MTVITKHNPNAPDIKSISSIDALPLLMPAIYDVFKQTQGSSIDISYENIAHLILTNHITRINFETK